MVAKKFGKRSKVATFASLVALAVALPLISGASAAMSGGSFGIKATNANDQRNL